MQATGARSVCYGRSKFGEGLVESAVVLGGLSTQVGIVNLGQTPQLSFEPVAAPAPRAHRPRSRFRVSLAQPGLGVLVGARVLGGLGQGQGGTGRIPALPIYVPR